MNNQAIVCLESNPISITTNKVLNDELLLLATIIKLGSIEVSFDSPTWNVKKKSINITIQGHPQPLDETSQFISKVAYKLIKDAFNKDIVNLVQHNDSFNGTISIEDNCLVLTFFYDTEEGQDDDVVIEWKRNSKQNVFSYLDKHDIGYINFEYSSGYDNGHFDLFESYNSQDKKLPDSINSALEKLVGYDLLEEGNISIASDFSTTGTGELEYNKEHDQIICRMTKTKWSSVTKEHICRIIIDAGHS